MSMIKRHLDEALGNPITVIDIHNQENSMEEMVEISEAEYNELLKAQDKLGALEAVGVDNWEGYGYAMEMLESDD